MLLSKIEIQRLLLTLTIGTAGGLVFYQMTLPLAWMLGAMVFCTIGSMSGLKLFIPLPFRSVMVAVLGVLLGSAFTPGTLQQAAHWLWSLAGMAVYLVLLTAMMYGYFRRVLKFDPTTAYFSATPGGLVEMVLVGGSMGGDDRRIALVHSTRVLLLVLTLPLYFRFTEGISAQATRIGVTIADLAFADLLVLLLCGVTGVVLGKVLRLPAYLLVGPMVVSGFAHINGISHTPPPVEIVSVAQIVMGAAIGARFVGIDPQQVLKIMVASVGATVLMLAATVAFALILAPANHLNLNGVILAFCPGGLAEMSLIALALGIETAFVATHHVVRIALIVVAAPWVFRLLGRCND